MSYFLLSLLVTTLRSSGFSLSAYFFNARAGKTTVTTRATFSWSYTVAKKESNTEQGYELILSSFQLVKLSKANWKPRKYDHKNPKGRKSSWVSVEKWTFQAIAVPVLKDVMPRRKIFVDSYSTIYLSTQSVTDINIGCLIRNWIKYQIVCENENAMSFVYWTRPRACTENKLWTPPRSQRRQCNDSWTVHSDDILLSFMLPSNIIR